VPGKTDHDHSEPAAVAFIQVLIRLEESGLEFSASPELKGLFRHGQLFFYAGFNFICQFGVVFQQAFH
jgi:hypothetical protein